MKPKQICQHRAALHQRFWDELLRNDPTVSNSKACDRICTQAVELSTTLPKCLSAVATHFCYRCVRPCKVWAPASRVRLNWWLRLARLHTMRLTLMAMLLCKWERFAKLAPRHVEDNGSANGTGHRWQMHVRLALRIQLCKQGRHIFLYCTLHDG